MSDLEYELRQVEDLEVLQWRRERLREAGYSDDQAVMLAEIPDIDLHEAIRLITAGCPPDQAIAILL